MPAATDVAIIGGGFTGLSAAYELAREGVNVTVIEADDEVGGLAGAFDVGGSRLDRFYHHWFTNDVEVMELIEELGLQAKVRINPTNTGVYYANRFFKLSSPMDLLRFKPLAFPDRIRLGLLALRARHVKDWRPLEQLTAEEWLRSLGGDAVYEVVWKPLLIGKFGPHAKDVSAVWFWNKLKLRGGSRGSKGEERLAYFDGGFTALANALAERVRGFGGRIVTGTQVTALRSDESGWSVQTTQGKLAAREVLATTALPLTANLLRGEAPPDYVASLERIEYLANVCLVLELDRPLSSTYWLNVNDPNFPFVAVVEHTNFVDAQTYGGRHIVYLSKYLAATDALFAMEADEMLAFALPHLRRMFPKLQDDWILEHHVWRARWAQPLVERNYGALIPPFDAPQPGLHICSMAQVYPEDRGTNYAIREGRLAGKKLLQAARA